MPLSFAALLGGTTTLIGTSTNLLAAGVAEKVGGLVIGFFEFTVPGGDHGGLSASPMCRWCCPASCRRAPAWPTR